MTTRISAAKAVRSQSASNTPTEAITFTASAEPVWIERVRTTTRAAAAAALRRPPSSGRRVFCASVMERVYSRTPRSPTRPREAAGVVHPTLVSRPPPWYLFAFPSLRTEVVHFPDSEDDMSARPKTPTHADEKHAILYGHPIPENSFAVRDLVHKLPGVGLFDLRRTETGAHACTFCGACQKACPVDCIDVRLRPLALARQGQGAPLRRHDHAGRAALHDLQPLHGDLQVRRARAHGAVPRAPAPRAGRGPQDAPALQPATASAAAAAPPSSSTRC